MIKKVINFMPFILFLLLTVTVYRQWFTLDPLSALDFNYVHHSAFSEQLFPYAWNLNRGGGFGGFYAPLLWNYFTQVLPANTIGKYIGLEWPIIQRLLFFYPFLILSFFSSLYLAVRIGLQKNFLLFSPAIFIFNTYALMLTGGGQIIIGLAYGISPFFFYRFVSLINTLKDPKTKIKKTLRESIINGLLLSLMILLDVRIAYVLMVGVLLYFLLELFLHRSTLNKTFQQVFCAFLFPGIITLFTHAFWLIPTLLGGSNPIAEAGAAYSSEAAVKFFSFAKLENTISLLHPNWPENIFGKVYFMKPEFLILPILAFVSLLFLNKNSKKKENEYITYFSLLGVLGVFLAKGVNDPFGVIYLWLFEYVPGFNMFRDATKWYTLVALSYSILIPYSVYKIYGWLKSSKYLIKSSIFNFQNLFLVLIISNLLFLISPSLTGKLGGTFKATNVPYEYMQLKDFLHNQPEFFRTIWIPHNPRFSYYSSLHPAVPATNYFNTTDIEKLPRMLQEKYTLSKLQEEGIKFVIVPFDSESEIFLTDRTYDESKYKNTVLELSNITWLTKRKVFGKIIVFEVPSSKDHFWSSDNNLQLNYSFINPTKYMLHLKNAEKNNKIIFSENYDPGWILKLSDGRIVPSRPYHKKLNSFILPENGTYTTEIYYRPQRLVDIGLIISLVSLLTISGVLFLIKKYETA